MERQTLGSYTGQTNVAALDVIAAAQEEVADLGVDLGSAIAAVCRHTLRLTRSDGAAVYVVEGDELVCVAGAGRTEQFVGLRLPAERLFAGGCLGGDGFEACDDVLADDRVSDEVAARLGIRSLLCHPISVGSVRAGVLEASSTSVAAFGRDDYKLIRALAALVCAAFRTASHATSDGRQDIDPVTGLPSPSVYRRRLGLEVERSRRTGEPVALAVVRLRGYYDGDALRMAARAVSGLRTIDEAFVVDGGTFAVIMPSTPLEGAMIAARKVSAVLAEPLAELGVHVRIGAAQQIGLDAGALHDAALDAAETGTTISLRRTTT